MRIWIKGVPVPQSRPRMSKTGGNVYSNASKALKWWKSQLSLEISSAISQLSIKPVEGAVCVDMVFMLPIKDKKRHGQISHTKPDKDNLEKAVLDVMESCNVFAVGDSQVGVGQVVKVWCPYGEQGLQITVSRVRIKKAPAKSEGDKVDWLA